MASTASRSDARRPARGVRDQLGGQGPGKSGLVPQENLLELIDVLESVAIGRDVGGVDFLALEIRHPPAVNEDGLAEPGDAVMVAPAADAVEALQGKSGRIDLAMACGTDSIARCLANCSRIVLAPRMSGSIAGTLSGGEGGVVPRMRSRTHAPRNTGEVVVPLAVTLSTPAIVNTPPRWLPGGRVVLRNVQPSTPAMP